MSKNTKALIRRETLKYKVKKITPLLIILVCELIALLHQTGIVVMVK